MREREVLVHCACGADAKLWRFGIRSYFICCTGRDCELETGAYLERDDAVSAWSKMVRIATCGMATARVVYPGAVVTA